MTRDVTKQKYVFGFDLIKFEMEMKIELICFKLYIKTKNIQKNPSDIRLQFCPIPIYIVFVHHSGVLMQRCKNSFAVGITV